MLLVCARCALRVAWVRRWLGETNAEGRVGTGGALCCVVVWDGRWRALRSGCWQAQGQRRPKSMWRGSMASERWLRLVWPETGRRQACGEAVGSSCFHPSSAQRHTHTHPGLPSHDAAAPCTPTAKQQGRGAQAGRADMVVLNNTGLFLVFCLRATGGQQARCGAGDLRRPAG